ncbi:MAG: hypothetical protein OEZ22_02445 [Spirochaetia bacterium]|nr:hypothetical protein [Spirochaetia bacterium]
MKYSWKYLRSREGDFPELFFLDTLKKEQIRVEVNRLKGIVKIIIDTLKNDSFYAVISNGVIIRERDLNNGKNRNLENEIHQRHIEISSLPDTEVLRLIGGNYGILTEFLGKADRKISKDVKELQGFFQKIINSYKNKFLNLYSKLKSIFLVIIEKPTKYDFLDAALSLGLGFGIYQLNFNLLHAGIMTLASSLAAGYADLLIRKKDPYLAKIIFLFIPSMTALYLGISYQ